MALSFCINLSEWFFYSLRMISVSGISLSNYMNITSYSEELFSLVDFQSKILISKDTYVYFKK